MKRRSFLLVFGLVAVAMLGSGAWLCWPDPPSLSMGRYRRLRLGMTRDQVEKIIGLPPGEYEYHFGWHVTSAVDVLDQRGLS
jgi:hypothetical protein